MKPIAGHCKETTDLYTQLQSLKKARSGHDFGLKIRQKGKHVYKVLHQDITQLNSTNPNRWKVPWGASIISGRKQILHRGTRKVQLATITIASLRFYPTKRLPYLRTVRIKAAVLTGCMVTRPATVSVAGVAVLDAYEVLGGHHTLLCIANLEGFSTTILENLIRVAAVALSVVNRNPRPMVGTQEHGQQQVVVWLQHAVYGFWT
jgi:hypothetical protein